MAARIRGGVLIGGATVVMGCMAAVAPLRAAEPTKEPTAEQVEFFETKIRPVLAEHCFECHGAKEQNNSLRLDSHDAILEGGDRGPAIVPGRADESLLITAVRYVEEDLQMPPEARLDDAILADLRRWIDDGAVWPEKVGAPEEDKAPATSYGALEPVVPPLESAVFGAGPHPAYVPLRRPGFPPDRRCRERVGSNTYLEECSVFSFQCSVFSRRRSVVRCQSSVVPEENSHHPRVASSSCPRVSLLRSG
jgi:hypothetical protein